ncbi:MAG: plastocyanin/azurin family copper-binding protein [Candidatus Methylomirabilota bacterium]
MRTKRRDLLWIGLTALALAAAAALAGAQAKTQVKIDGVAFEPPIIQVNLGDSVTWTNNYKQPHLISTFKKVKGASVQDGVLDSPMLKTGESFTHKFEKPGTYEYFCPIHVFMLGKVVVKK